MTLDLQIMPAILQPGRISPQRSVPAAISHPEYVGRRAPRGGEPDVKDAGTIDDHIDFLSEKLDANQTAHKKAVTKLAKAMCKAAFGEEEQPDEKTLAALAYACASSGRTDRAREVVTLMQDRSRVRNLSAYFIAVAFTGLNELDSAFHWLERASDRHESNLMYLAVEPKHDALRPDPRFDALLRRVGLPQPK